MIHHERVRQRLQLFTRVAADTGSYDDAMWAVLQQEQRYHREHAEGERKFSARAQAVVNCTCEVLAVPLLDFLGPSRLPAFVDARWVAMRALRDLGYSLPVIGLHVSRTHAAVIWGLDRLADRPDLMQAAEHVRLTSLAQVAG